MVLDVNNSTPQQQEQRRLQQQQEQQEQQQQAQQRQQEQQQRVAGKGNAYLHKKNRGEQEREPRCPMAEAVQRGFFWGWASYWTYYWAGPLLTLGASRTLTDRDLPGVGKAQQSRHLYTELRRCWETENAKLEAKSSKQGDGSKGGTDRTRYTGTTLLRALVRACRGKLLRMGLLLVVDSAVHIFQAITLGWLVSYFEDKNAESWEGWVYALCVVVCTVTFNLLHHMYFFQGYTLGMEVRVMATMVIYDKILRLRLSSLGQMTTGHLVNLASSDVERFQLGATFFHFLWEAPLETLVVLYFGVSIVGVSFVAGYAALAFLVPMQAAFSRKFTSVRQRVTVLTDERVKLTNQAVTGARVMKMNAWEPALEREIRRVRAEEIRVLLKAALLRAINEALFFVQPALLATIVFGTYNFLGNDLKPSEVFTTLGLLNITQFTMGKFFYMAIQNSSESWVSIKRLETLLLMKENEFLVGHLLEFDASVGASRAETSNPESRKKGVDDSATTVTAADDPVGSKMEAPAAAPSADCNDSSAIRRTASVDSAANGSGGSGRAGAISVQTSSFRWGDDGEDQVAESERVVKKLAVPERSIGTKATTYHGANTDGTHEQVDRNSDESASASEGRSGGMDFGRASVHVPAAVTGEDRPHEADFTLKSIDLTVEPGQLVGIVGPVGSAKSSLLMAVLREIVPVKDGGGKKVRMNHKDGTMDAGNIGVSVGGRVAYAPQEPWIQSGTVRDNILFGKPMDRRRYDAVVRDCSLEHDLSVLPAGDMTGIGDRGVNLSGGQKARLGLARMAYTRADVYIMDDPLSAVDPAVGRELFSRVVCGRLSGSTRLLVTHQVHYLRDAALDMMIVMQDGKIVARGRYKELEASDALSGLELGRGPLNSDFESDSKVSDDGEESDASALNDAIELDMGSLENMARLRRRSRDRSGDTTGEGRSGNGARMPMEDDSKSRPLPAELVAEENKETGVLKRRTYVEFVKEMAGVWQIILILVAMALGQAMMMAVTVWIARWSQKSGEEQKRKVYVGTLIILTLGTVVVSVFRAALSFFALVRASHRTHDRMLARVVRSPILFFDSNPVGRILNRFTKDTHFMDDMLPMTLFDFLMSFFMVLGSVTLVLAVNPWMSPSLVPAAVYFMHLLNFYTKTSREVKRLEAVARSPVYSQLSETLDGLVTIRAFGVQKEFLTAFLRKVDDNTRAYFAYIFTSRWFGFRLETVALVVLTVCCFVAVAVSEYREAADAGLLGVALVYVIQLGALFQWTVRQAAEVENQMVSAERILAYCRLEQEASLESNPENKPADDWPTKGNIEIRDLVLRYRKDLPLVLKGLNFSITGGSRVGVVGRTGAGKSSLVAALFRLVEYDTNRRGIEIDGVDTSKLGLHDLRPRMSVVPQTPFLFSGSVRLNLDPFSRHSDAAMWDALEAVQMKDYVTMLPGGLDALVTEGGANLSVGQRQLLCLARAVLQRSQILVMDEATANIDRHTDALIQGVVRTSFAGRTVIMIAHRLNTVIDCDQVVVLSEGRVVESGHPHTLLQNPAQLENSNTLYSQEGGEEGGAVEGQKRIEAAATFSSMVDETGPASSELLRRLAKEAWEA